MSKNKKREIKRIVITGGHAGSTAYATIEQLRQSYNYAWAIYFIGSKSAIEGRKVQTLENTIFPKIGVKNYPITTGRIQRKFTIWTIPSLLKIPIGFINAYIILARIKPDITLSFGGFAAFPVVVSSYLLKIPVVVHEQTTCVGRANKYSAFFAKKIALSRKESLSYFPSAKCVVTGNPISKEISSLSPKKDIGVPPVVFVTGGSRGSSILNRTVAESLREILGKYNLIHQTGFLDYGWVSKERDKLPMKQKNNYKIYSVIEPWKWPNYISSSDLVISRAGANIVSELIAVKKLAILIPIPFSYENEQMKNAQYAKSLGVAEIIEQESLTSEGLTRLIDKIMANWEKKVKNIKNPQIDDKDASKKLVNLIESLL
jgi:UDP-N-acetylglucosamine--N-acetylmuramyl-(pentapeptide) pyrophosphoryl-undecaprenol N-acetylglucosamine transferase